MSFSKTGAGESAARPRVLAPLIATLILLGLGLALPMGASALRASSGSGWHAQNASAAGSDASLNSVYFADAAHGWAVGNSQGVSGYAPVILATTDGGATWGAQDSGSAGINASLNSVRFVDSTHGWAVGDSYDASAYGTSVILATTDGGATWSAQDPGSAGIGGSLKSVFFIDAAHGWAVGDSFDASGYYAGPVMLATTDGGATWTARDVSSVGGSQLSLGAVTFADTNHGWAVGSTGGDKVSILSTSDGGATWSAKAVRDGHDGMGGASLHSVCFVDAKHGWAVGGAGGEDPSCLPIIIATRDGGATWNTEKVPRAYGDAYLYSVTFVDAEHGWLVGANVLDRAAIVLATSDGGTTWKAQDTGIPGELAGHDRSAALTSVAFADATHGWAVGDSIYVPTGSSVPVIVDTTNGGFPASVPTPKVTLKLSGLTSGAMRLGKSVTAKGKVTPTSLAGSQVKLTVQKKRSARWVTLKSVKRTISATGAYSWKYKPARRGAYRMRATIAKTAAHTAATTKWLAFKVK